MADLTVLAAAVLAAVPGGALGWLAGLVPGLHANNLARALVAYPAFALAPAAGAAGAAAGSPEAMAASAGFLFGMAVGHAFGDDVPAVFLGAPDADTALSILPGHRLLAQGHGVEAVRAAARGSLLGVILCLPLVPALAWVMGPPLNAYSALRPFFPAILLTLAAVLVLGERGSGSPDGLRRTRARLVALGVLLASGALGDTVMFRGLPAWGPLPGGAPLLALFAGLFGIPTLVLSLFARTGPPPEEVPGNGDPIDARATLKSAGMGAGAGAIVGWLPGIGAAQATTLAFAVWDRLGRRPREGERREAARFLVAASAVSTANLMFNLVALSVLGRERSGVMVALDTVAAPELAGVGHESLVAGLLAGAVACLPVCYFLTQWAGRGAARLYRKVPPQRFSLAALALLVVLIAGIEGPLGLAVAVLATALGLVPPFAGIKRVHLMGCVLLPVSLRIATL